MTPPSQAEKKKDFKVKIWCKNCDTNFFYTALWKHEITERGWGDTSVWDDGNIIECPNCGSYTLKKVQK